MKFHRIAAGDYESADGTFRLVQLDGGRTRAWNVEYTDAYIERRIEEDPENVTAYSREFDLIVDGAATKRDALALFDDWYAAATREPDGQRVGDGGRIVSASR